MLAAMKARDILLGVGAVIGVGVAAPIVVRYATVWWWLSVPAIGAYAVALWRWGLAWITDDDDVADAPVADKVVGVLILLGWSFVGIALLVYLAMLAAQNWPLVVAALLVLAAFVLVMWLGELFDKRKPTAGPDDTGR